MENKYVGYILIGVSIMFIVVILLFNFALKEIIETSCGQVHGEICPMNKTVNTQTVISFLIVGFLLIVSFIFIFSKPQKEVVVRTRFLKNNSKLKKVDYSGLRSDEREVLNLIKENQAIFQADLIEKTGMGKAKMSRIIDRLEGRGYVERKRRGLTNVVVLKTE